MVLGSDLTHLKYVPHRLSLFSYSFHLVDQKNKSNVEYQELQQVFNHLVWYLWIFGLRVHPEKNFFSICQMQNFQQYKKGKMLFDILWWVHCFCPYLTGIKNQGRGLGDTTLRRKRMGQSCKQTMVRKSTKSDILFAKATRIRSSDDCADYTLKRRAGRDSYLKRSCTLNLLSCYSIKTF